MGVYQTEMIPIMNTKYYPFSTLFVLLAATLMFFAACDNAVDDDGHSDHAEAHGLRLTLNGVNVYQVLEGEVSCSSAPCGITISEGEETALISATFLDHDGDALSEAQLNEDQFSLGHEFETAGVAEFEQHDEDGKWRFHIHGEAAGTTAFQLKLMHGDHADFTTPPVSNENAIQITVTE